MKKSVGRHIIGSSMYPSAGGPEGVDVLTIMTEQSNN